MLVDAVQENFSMDLKIFMNNIYSGSGGAAHPSRTWPWGDPAWPGCQTASPFDANQTDEPTGTLEITRTDRQEASKTDREQRAKSKKRQSEIESERARLTHRCPLPPPLSRWRPQSSEDR